MWQKNALSFRAADYWFSNFYAAALHNDTAHFTTTEVGDRTRLDINTRTYERFSTIARV